jgi:branched-chain amino acid transport system permease protein
LTLGSLYALLTAGLTLLFGAQRTLFFAYGGLYAMGGYIAWWMIRASCPIWMALGSAILLCALLGSVFIWGGRVVRAQPSAQARLLREVGLLVCLAEIGRLIMGPSHRKVIAIDSHQIHHVGPLMLSDMHWLIFGSAFVCLIGLNGFLTTSRIGRAAYAWMRVEPQAGQEPWQATLTRLLACASGTALAGVSGALAALYVNDVYPAMGVHITHKIVSLVLIGRLGSLQGAVLAAYGLAFMEVMILPTLHVAVPLEAMLLFALLLVSWRLRPDNNPRRPFFRTP